MKFLKLSNYFRWLSELREFWALRRTTSSFVAFNNNESATYIPLPHRIWPTKSHEWWSFLAALLRVLIPEYLLELGSGRSSVYLSEYAHNEGKTLISIDNDKKWIAANRLVSRFGCIPDDYLHHVDLGPDGYYQIDQLKKIVTIKPDFVYLDGPNIDRSGVKKYRYIHDLCSSAKTIIIDDVQWGHIWDQIDYLQDNGMKRKRRFIAYQVKNPEDRMLCLLTSVDYEDKVNDIVRCLGINIIHEWDRGRCIDE